MFDENFPKANIFFLLSLFSSGLQLFKLTKTIFFSNKSILTSQTSLLLIFLYYYFIQNFLLLVRQRRKLPISFFKPIINLHTEKQNNNFYDEVIRVELLFRMLRSTLKDWLCYLQTEIISHEIFPSGHARSYRVYLIQTSLYIINLQGVSYK